MKVFYTIILLAFATTFSQAQIEEGVRSMSQGSNNSLSLDIPEANSKLAKKVWTKYLKSNSKGSKTKSDKKTGMIFTDNAEVISIGGANTIDIYMRFTDVGENVNATIWYDLGGAYLSSEMHGDKYNEGEKFLMRFAIAVAVESTKLELNAEEKKAKELAKQLASLKKKEEGYHKDIAIAEQKIKEAEANIEQNIQEQEATDSAIIDQGAVVDTVKGRLEELEK
ncbi:MAG: vacuolar-type H+-ATPase subunit I/STV1 [Maribacter sp.]|jgi:vacuolar-type H+-ATPase subunit I/STV1